MTLDAHSIVQQHVMWNGTNSEAIMHVKCTMHELPSAWGLNRIAIGIRTCSHAEQGAAKGWCAHTRHSCISPSKLLLGMQLPAWWLRHPRPAGSLCRWMLAAVGAWWLRGRPAP